MCYTIISHIIIINFDYFLLVSTLCPCQIRSKLSIYKQPAGQCTSKKARTPHPPRLFLRLFR